MVTEPLTQKIGHSRQAQRFLSAHDQIANLFHLRRDAVTSIEHRAARTRALSIWAEISGVTAAA